MPLHSRLETTTAALLSDYTGLSKADTITPSILVSTLHLDYMLISAFVLHDTGQPVISATTSYLYICSAYVFLIVLFITYVSMII